MGEQSSTLSSIGRSRGGDSNLGAEIQVVHLLI